MAPVVFTGQLAEGEAQRGIRKMASICTKLVSTVKFSNGAPSWRRRSRRRWLSILIASCEATGPIGSVRCSAFERGDVQVRQEVLQRASLTKNRAISSAIGSSTYSVMRNRSARALPTVLPRGAGA